MSLSAELGWRRVPVLSGCMIFFFFFLLSIIKVINKSVAQALNLSL